ncbi:dnaJ homolog subfamily C member 7-like isoform X2 [Symsagittifera roscoffensis]|uniref:dnaJ homolog subfamily C member 7-like isoform X2 n=1 Tax=Symsagittifera roscoffensis TaxID=84072 RepID=UPI00307B442D
MADTDVEMKPCDAEQKKQEGNDFHKKKDYKSAIKSYSEAIRLDPENFSLFGNRSASYMMLGQYTSALEDAKLSTSLNSNFIKGYVREIKCHIALGQAAAAQNIEQKVLNLDANLSADDKRTLDECGKQIAALTAHEAKARKAIEVDDCRTAAYYFEQCSKFAPSNTSYKVLRAECLAMLGKFTDANELASEVVRKETNADAIFVLALCNYYQDNMEKAIKLLAEVLRLAPDHTKSRETHKKVKKLSKMKEEGNEAFKRGAYQKAYEIYSEALSIDPHNKITNAKLYCNRATTGSKLKKIEDSIKDCDKAIQLDENYEKAFIRRAALLQEDGRYEEAVRDCEHVYKKNPNPTNKRHLQEAKLELKKSKRKDYYKLLGVEKTATEEEIKKAYKKLALVHHPDRHQADPEEEKAEHERKFKDIGEAYSVLSDQNKRHRYDTGQDLEDMDGPGGFHDVDPSQIFQMFFGGGGGVPGGHPGAGSGRSHRHSSFGGPGGGVHFSFG